MGLETPRMSTVNIAGAFRPRVLDLHRDDLPDTARSAIGRHGGMLGLDPMQNVDRCCPILTDCGASSPSRSTAREISDRLIHVFVGRRGSC
jgi:hypothetical protein